MLCWQQRTSAISLVSRRDSVPALYYNRKKLEFDAIQNGLYCAKLTFSGPPSTPGILDKDVVITCKSPTSEKTVIGFGLGVEAKGGKSKFYLKD